jgi:hypothetical protein
MNLLGGTKENHESFGQNSRCASPFSNQEPPEYKSDALLIEPACPGLKTFHSVSFGCYEVWRLRNERLLSFIQETFTIARQALFLSV